MGKNKITHPGGNGNGNGDAAHLFDLGVLVQVNIGQWSGRRMLTRADLLSVGINPDELPEEICNLGRKLLVPKEELSKFTQIDQNARAYLAQWSIPFGIGSASFVPIKLLPDVQAKLEQYKTDFYGLVDSFIARFEEMKARIQAEYPGFWEKCLKNHYPPTPKLLGDRFYFRFFFFKVAGVGSIQGTSVDEAIAQDQVRQERLVELRRQMQQEVSQFVEQAVSTMRVETVQFCDLVLARINGRPHGDEEEAKKFTARSLQSFRRYVDHFKQMNVFGDAEIEKMLDEFKQKYLDPTATPASLQTPQMRQAIAGHLGVLRKLAAAEDGESSFIQMVKRHIEL